MAEMSGSAASAEPSISRREYIRWIPEPASESTSALVLTTRNRRYIDVRITRSADSSEPELPNEGGPLSRLSWAFAGTSHTTLQPPAYAGPPSQAHNGARSSISDRTSGNAEIPADAEEAKVPHCKWSHWIDSLAPPFLDEETSDEGDMYPISSSQTLERGVMVNPATGKEQLYEESWLDDEPVVLPGEGGVRDAAIKLTQTDEKGRTFARGMIIRVGQHVEGLIKVVREEEGREVAELSCERWEWSEAGDWRRTVKIGRLFLPCAVAFEKELEVGKEVKYGDWLWKVVEVQES